MTEHLTDTEDHALPPGVPQNLPYPGTDGKLRERIVCPKCKRRASRYYTQPPIEYLCYACNTPMRPLTTSEWVEEWRRPSATKDPDGTARTLAVQELTPTPPATLWRRILSKLKGN